MFYLLTYLMTQSHLFLDTKSLRVRYILLVVLNALNITDITYLPWRQVSFDDPHVNRVIPCNTTQLSSWLSSKPGHVQRRIRYWQNRRWRLIQRSYSVITSPLHRRHIVITVLLQRRDSVMTAWLQYDYSGITSPLHCHYNVITALS